MKKISLTVLFLMPLSACIVIPLPTGMAPGLKKDIETLSSSTQTKALAYAGEDKTFGSKYFVWGKYAGALPQMDANKIALDQCYNGLIKARAEELGGVKKWNFGDQKCELYSFPNLPDTAIVPPGYIPPVGAIIAPPNIRPTEQNQNPAGLQATSIPPLPKNTAPTSNEKKLQDLKSLFDRGLISKQDYDNKKSEILKGM